jgi:hypothetical protein
MTTWTSDQLDRIGKAEELNAAAAPTRRDAAPAGDAVGCNAQQAVDD